MAGNDDTRSRVSFFGAVCLLGAGATPLVWRCIHRLNEASLKASVSLPEVSATEDTVGNWALFTSLFLAAAFAGVVILNDWKTRRWSVPVILLGILLVPFSLVLSLGLTVPPIYVPTWTSLLLILGVGVLATIGGCPFCAFLGIGGPWLAPRMSLVWAGFSLSLLVTFPLGLFGEHWIREREVSLRQQYNVEQIRKARVVAESACQLMKAYETLIADLESQAIPADEAAESSPPALRGPALYYWTFDKTRHESIDVHMTIKGLGPCRPTPELTQLARLTNRQDFSYREADGGATLTQSCAPFHDFRIYYGPERTLHLNDCPFGVAEGGRALPDPNTIGTVVRVNLVKSETIGHYEGTSIIGKRTTIEVQIITLPAKRIVAKRSFVGHPLHSISARSKVDSLDGMQDALDKARPWLDSLFVAPDSPQDGVAEVNESLE